MPTVAQRRALREQQRLIERLIEQAERSMRSRFTTQIEWLRSKVTIAELEAAIKARRDNLIDPQLIRTAARVLAQVATEQSIRAAKAIARAQEETLSFDEENTRAVRAMERREDRFEKDFSKEQARNFKRIMLDGIKAGDNPRAIAKDIRAGIGLTPYQSRIVSNYRRALEDGQRANALGRALRDRRFDRRVKSGELTEAQIDGLVDNYRSRWVKHRAEMLARRESHRSVHEGAEDMWKQAVDEGDLKKGELVRVWISTNDTRTRDSHRGPPLDGQRRKLGEPFISGLGNRLMFPGDPDAPSEEIEGCRCTVATIFA